MGMFDNVKYSRACYKCGHTLTDWQSKDGPCMLDTLETWQVTNLYTPCLKCQAWNEYTVEVIVASIEFTRVNDDGRYKRDHAACRDKLKYPHTGEIATEVNTVDSEQQED